MRRIPHEVNLRAEENYVVYRMSKLGSFKEAAKTLAKRGSHLWKAWYYDDFREYIPEEYQKEALDFEKYPLPYK